MSLLLAVKDDFIREVSGSFDPKIDFSKRVRVIADVEMFNFKEDPYIFAQKRDNTALCYQVYFDDVFISLFYDDQIREQAVLEFWKGFYEAIKNGKISLTPPDHRIEVKEKDTQEEAIAALPESTPIEKMAKSVVKNLKSKKGTSDKPLATATRR